MAFGREAALEQAPLSAVLERHRRGVLGGCGRPSDPWSLACRDNVTNSEILAGTPSTPSSVHLSVTGDESTGWEACIVRPFTARTSVPISWPRFLGRPRAFPGEVARTAWFRPDIISIELANESANTAISAA
jgi:hypothetical protein